MPNDQLNKKGAITKLDEHATEQLKEIMTKLYDYFNAPTE
jgi:hypothetical protein